MNSFILKKYVGMPALLVFIASAAHAGACTNASLVGVFGLQEQGMHTDSLGFSEFRTIGSIKFDGRGNGTKAEILWFRDFSINNVTFPISYNVRPDCSFTYTELNSGESYEGEIIANGTKLLYMEVSGDPVRSGQAERIRTTF